MKRLVVILNLVDELYRIIEVFDKNKIDYRLSGVLASTFYGRGLTTNVLDFVLESEEDVRKAEVLLGYRDLPGSFEGYDPYVIHLKDLKGYVRLQAGEMGNPVYFEGSDVKVHSKRLLLCKMYEYGKTDVRVVEQAAFLAITIDEEKIHKYKSIWNRM